MPPPAPALGAVPPTQALAHLIFSPTEAPAAGSVGASLAIVVVRELVLVGPLVFVVRQAREYAAHERPGGEMIQGGLPLS